MEDSKKVKIVSRIGNVTYIIPEMQNLQRTFSAREEKIVPFEELRRLMYVPGGRTLLEQYLIIKDKDVIEELGLDVEPEYFYNEEEIKDLFVNGSLDQFLDCLDFAPEGVIDMIKSLAVSLPLNDVAKRQAILDKTGFDVTRAIELGLTSNNPTENKKTGRRAAVPIKGKQGQQNSAQGSGRRVVIKPEEKK